MPALRTNVPTPYAPATSRTLPEDVNWKHEAACADHTGPVMQVPLSLCAACSVRTECNALYLELQETIDATRDPNEAKQHLGGIWGGLARQEARHQVAFGSVPIEPCPDSCTAPRHARGACRNHYNQQYIRHKAG